MNTEHIASLSKESLDEDFELDIRITNTSDGRDSAAFSTILLPSFRTGCTTFISPEQIKKIE